jgi:hypothetical protein
MAIDYSLFAIPKGGKQKSSLDMSDLTLGKPIEISEKIRQPEKK